MLYSTSETEKPDNAIVSLFGTTYIGFALADSIGAPRKHLLPPYYCCGVRLPDGRGVWIVGLTYEDHDIAYFWDWRAARDYQNMMNAQ